MNGRRARIVVLAVGVVLVVATSALFLAYTNDRTGVWLSAPLDDTFIHFQYAKQLARGRLFQFNDGDSPTTGATSPLYLVLLAPGWLIGFRGLKLLIWAWLVNGGLHLVGGLCIFSILRRLVTRRALAWTGMCAYLVSGPLLWGTYSHMEVGLFSAMALLTLLEVVKLSAATEDDGGVPPPSRRLLLWGSLLALVRPEGLIMAGGLTLWLFWRHLGQGEEGEGRSTRDALRRLPRRLWSGRRLALPLGTGVALLLLYLVLTGRVATNASVKSHLRHLSTEPGLYVTTTLNWVPMTLQILLEKWPRLIQPLTGILTLVGITFWAARGRLRRPRAGALVLGWLLLLTLFYSLFIARRDHLDRYYLPYWGLTVVAIWWTLGRTAERLKRHSWGPVLLSGLFLLLMVPQTRTWAARYGDNCRDLVQQHFKIAAWLRQNTPADTRIAVNDAGAIPYLSGRYSYDIVGLTHNAFFGRKTHMPHYQTAPVWEALEALPARPDYMVAYPEWIPDLHRLLPFEVVTRFPLKNRTIVANETMVVWKLNWSRLLDANRPPPPAAGRKPRLIDRLDIADLASEDDHDYERLDEGRPEGLVRQQLVGGGKQAMIDGGRYVKKGEAFTLRCHPGKPAILLLRVFGRDPVDIDVKVNGRGLGRWKAPGAATPAAFTEVPFLIPEERVVGGELRFRLEAHAPYASFHYWLMQ